MTDSNREDRLIDTFATLADTLIDDYDVVDLLQTLVESCSDLFDVAAAGLLLADADGELEVIASTSEASRLVEVMQLSARAGPCVESFRTGTVVSLTDIAESPPEWSRFRDSAREQGFAAVFAIPLRLRETTIGTLNLLAGVPGALPHQDMRAAQALADVATIGILQERMLRESRSIREQLTNALQSRVLIEQAKGVLAHSRGISMEEAFTLLRTYARTNRLLLSKVAQGLVEQSLVI